MDANTLRKLIKEEENINYESLDEQLEADARIRAWKKQLYGYHANPNKEAPPHRERKLLDDLFDRMEKQWKKY